MCMDSTASKSSPTSTCRLSQVILPPGLHRNGEHFTPDPPLEQHQITCSTSHSPESQCTPLNTEATLAQLRNSGAVSSKQDLGLIQWEETVSGPLCDAARRLRSDLTTCCDASSFISARMGHAQTFCAFDPRLSKLIISQKNGMIPWSKTATVSRCNGVTEGLISAFARGRRAVSI